MKTWKATKQEVLDHLVGAGADQYDWYTQLDDSDGVITVGMEDPDDPDTEIVKTVTVTQAKEIVAEMITKQAGGYKHIVRAIESDDFDANDADIVLQWITLGELVYG
jgi:uncharacterized membrane protein YjjP (DUF1212 family)